MGDSFQPGIPDECLGYECGAPGDTMRKLACAEAGWSGARSCFDPSCSPWCNQTVYKAVMAKDPTWQNVDFRAGLLGGFVSQLKGCCGNCGGNVNSGSGPSLSSGVVPSGISAPGDCGCDSSLQWDGIPWWLLLVIAFLVLIKK